MWHNSDNTCQTNIVWYSYRVQVQYGCAIIQLLMSRLDENNSADTAVKTCIVGVLTEIVHITAEGSIGINSIIHTRSLKVLNSRQ